MTVKLPADCKRVFRIAGALVGLAVVLGACTHTDGVAVTASVPDDYRLRHPIAIQEADRSVVIFIGHARGRLSGPQRADVMGLAQLWLQEGTGVITRLLNIPKPNDPTTSEQALKLATDYQFRLMSAPASASISARIRAS